MTKKHNTRQLIVNLQDIKWAQWVRGLSENYLRDLYHWWSSCHLCLVTVGMIPTPAKQDHQGPDNLSDFPFFILVNGNWLKAQLRREASSGSKKYWANSMLDMLTVRQEKFQMGFLFKNRKKKKTYLCFRLCFWFCLGHWCDRFSFHLRPSLWVSNTSYSLGGRRCAGNGFDLSSWGRGSPVVAHFQSMWRCYWQLPQVTISWSSWL